jgi:hypothetical protein
VCFCGFLIDFFGFVFLFGKIAAMKRKREFPSVEAALQNYKHRFADWDER